MLPVDLTEDQWKLLEPFFADWNRDGERGRPRQDPRAIMNGLLWVLRTGAPWMDLPPRYPPYQTCHRWFQVWSSDGTLEAIFRELARDLKERGGIDVTECFIDGSFAGAKKGGSAWEKQSAGKGPRSWPLQTALVFLSEFGSTVLRRMKQGS